MADIMEPAKAPPPPGMGFDDPEKQDPEDENQATKLVNDDKNLSKYQLKRMESHIPDSMALYEQNTYVQIFLLIVTACIAYANVSFNFRMIDLYREVENQLKADIALEQTGSPSNEAALLSEFANRTADGEFLCDAAYFSGTEFSSEDLQSTVTTLRIIAEASTYLAVGIFVPMHLIFKAMSAFYLTTNDFTGTQAKERHNLGEETKHLQLTTMGGRAASRAASVGGSVPLKNQIQTRQGLHSMILENEDEKNVRIFLRGESILFAWIQGFQDIPQASLAVLFIVLQRAIRGSFCFDQYIDGVSSLPQEYDAINADSYYQIGLVAMSAIWNIMMLGARWLRYFHYKTIKFEKKPRPLALRLLIAFVWTLAYMMAVATPVFFLIYTGVGDSIIGFPSDAAELSYFLYLSIAGAACAVFGFLLIFCWWGTNFSEGVCVGCVVWEAFCVGVTACELEVCEVLCC